MPDEVVQNIVSYIPFRERQKLRLVSQQFQHSIDSMRWPALKLDFQSLGPGLVSIDRGPTRTWMRKTLFLWAELTM